MIRSRNLIYSGVFIALGILVPMVFHLFGIGSYMLPMFWPVALSAFFLPVSFAAGVALLTPPISMVITGMPAVPVAYLMMIELLTLNLVICVLAKRSALGSLFILLIGFVLSRSALYLASVFLAPILGLPAHFVSFYQVMQGLPGMVTMLILLPVLLNRFHYFPLLVQKERG